MAVRAILSRVAMVLGSMLAVFIVAEIVLRLALYGSLNWQHGEYTGILIRAPHPTYGWLLDPDQQVMVHSTEYRVFVKTNERGLRDRSIPYEKPEDTFRIVVLGDSYMEAAHVEEADMFSRRLEEALADYNVETVNLGVGGYNTVSPWLYLLEEGFKYDPDLVLLGFYAENDIYGNSPSLSRQFWREDNIRYFGQPYALWDEEAEALEIVPPDYERSSAEFEERLSQYSPTLERLDGLRKSVISQLYRQALDAARTRVRTPGYDLNIHLGAYLEDFSHVGEDDPMTAEEYAAHWDEAWFLTERLIAAMADDCREREVAFAFFNAPAQTQFQSAYLEAVEERYPEFDLDIDLPERRLGALAEEEGIPFLNLLPAFREADAAGQDINYRRDSHWNPAGHRLAAEVTAAWLVENGLVP